MQIIGQDSEGYPIAIQHGLIASTIYRGRPKARGLHDLGLNAGGVANFNAAMSGGGGGFNWETLFTGINPIIQGIGARIAGGNPPVSGYPQQQIQASGPGFFGSISPTMLMMGAGAVVLLLVLRKR